MGSAKVALVRAVLDTNVVISALVFEGKSSALAPAWKHRQFTLLVSQALVTEYVRVLHYPKFRLTRQDIRYLLEEELLPFLTPVRVTRTPQVIRADPSDDHVLACAVSGKADLIVSGDHHLLDLKRYRKIPIVPLAHFIDQLGL